MSKTWKIDPMHSEIQFKVRHMMISNVTGSFSEFDSTFNHENDDFTDSKIEFLAKINSINTGNEQRDGHLKSGEFFDSEKFPELKFSSTSLVKLSGSEYKMDGNMTIKGVTRPVSLNVEFNGIQKDLYGQTKAGFEITGSIKRKDFGLTWDAVTETGGVVLGDEIKLTANVQYIQG